eukprot:6475604-Amphidinium_carterae.2
MAASLSISDSSGARRSLNQLANWSVWVTLIGSAACSCGCVDAITCGEPLLEKRTNDRVNFVRMCLALDSATPH